MLLDSIHRVSLWVGILFTLQSFATAHGQQKSNDIDSNPKVELNIPAKIAWLNQVMQGNGVIDNSDGGNFGVTPITNGRITVLFGTTFRVFALSASQGTCGPVQDGRVQCDLGNIPAGTKVSFTFNFEATSMGSGDLVAEFTSDTPDPDPSDNRVVCTIEVFEDPVAYVDDDATGPGVLGDPNNPFPTLFDGLDAVRAVDQSGAELRTSAGAYPQDLDIDLNVTVRGWNGETGTFEQLDVEADTRLGGVKVEDGAMLTFGPGGPYDLQGSLTTEGDVLARGHVNVRDQCSQDGGIFTLDGVLGDGRRQEFTCGGTHNVAAGEFRANGAVVRSVGDFVLGPGDGSVPGTALFELGEGEHYTNRTFLVGPDLDPSEPCVADNRNRYRLSGGTLNADGDVFFEGTGDFCDDSAFETDEQGLDGTIRFTADGRVQRVSQRLDEDALFPDVIITGPGSLVDLASDIRLNRNAELTLESGIVDTNEEFNWIILNPGIEVDLARRNNSARGSGVIQLGSRDSYINGESSRRVEFGNAGAGVVTGGYLFPVGSSSEVETPGGGTRTVDFFRPLILQFPDDLGRSSLARVNYRQDLSASDECTLPSGGLNVDAVGGGSLGLDVVSDQFWQLDFDRIPSFDPNLRVEADGLENVFDIKSLRLIQWDCDCTNPRLAGTYDLESDPGQETFAANDFVSGVPNITQSGVDVNSCQVFGIATDRSVNPIDEEAVGAYIDPRAGAGGVLGSPANPFSTVGGAVEAGAKVIYLPAVPTDTIPDETVIKDAIISLSTWNTDPNNPQEGAPGSARLRGLNLENAEVRMAVGLDLILEGRLRIESGGLDLGSGSATIESVQEDTFDIYLGPEASLSGADDSKLSFEGTGDIQVLIDSQVDRLTYQLPSIAVNLSAGSLRFDANGIPSTTGDADDPDNIEFFGTRNFSIVGRGTVLLDDGIDLFVVQTWNQTDGEFRMSGRSSGETTRQHVRVEGDFVLSDGAFVAESGRVCVEEDFTMGAIGGEDEIGPASGFFSVGSDGLHMVHGSFNVGPRPRSGERQSRSAE